MSHTTLPSELQVFCNVSNRAMFANDVAVVVVVVELNSPPTNKAKRMLLYCY